MFYIGANNTYGERRSLGSIKLGEYNCTLNPMQNVEA
jgi:hypothetical protein